MLMATTTTKRRPPSSPKPIEPEGWLAALAKRAVELQRDIDAALDELVASDRAFCPKMSAPVIKSLRTAQHLYGFCACRWVRDEAATCCKDEA
jgi:hypothetical protein